MGDVDHYEKTHELLDAARTAVAGNETKKAFTFLIEAVEQTTLGWGTEGVEDLDEDAGPEPTTEAPTLPSLPNIMVQGRNCISVLNEHAQKRGIEMPHFDYEGNGPFTCTCCFLEQEVRSGKQRTKNEAKHDAAVRMLQMLRRNR